MKNIISHYVLSYRNYFLRLLLNTCNKTIRAFMHFKDCPIKCRLDNYDQSLYPAFYSRVNIVLSVRESSIRIHVANNNVFVNLRFHFNIITHPILI